MSVALTTRSSDEVRKLFGGLQLVPPYEGAEPDVTWVGIGIVTTRR